MKKFCLFSSVLLIFCIITNISYGAPCWMKTYGGGGHDEIEDIQQISDGGYIATGYTDSYGEGKYDALILKLDSNGDVSWQKTYGGSDFEAAYSIDQTSDGGYIVAGQIRASESMNSDYLVVKLDNSGNTIWNKRYDFDDGDLLPNNQSTCYFDMW